MKCSVCGMSGVRLWRTTHTVASAVDLFCVACGLDRERDHIINYTSMRRTLREHLDSGALGYLVAARPTDDGSYWGHTSGPQSSVDAWVSLPFRAALAGSPVETRRPSASLALHDRALAERVREAAAKRCERIAMDESRHVNNLADDCAEAVRALDLDAMLEEP